MATEQMDWTKYKNTKEWYSPVDEYVRRGEQATTKVVVEQLQLVELSLASPSDYRHMMKLFGRVQKVNRRDKRSGEFEVWVQSRLTQCTMEIQRKGKGSPDAETYNRAREIAMISDPKDRLKALSEYRIAFAEAHGLGI